VLRILYFASKIGQFPLRMRRTFVSQPGGRSLLALCPATRGRVLLSYHIRVANYCSASTGTCRPAQCMSFRCQFPPAEHERMS